MNDTYTPEQAHAAVERGAAWMDEHCPKWVGLIELRVLQLRNSDTCVLGQTATCLVGPSGPRDFTPGFYRVLDEYPTLDTCGLGFNIPLARTGDLQSRRQEARTRYEMLDIAWRTYIEARRAAAVVAV